MIHEPQRKFILATAIVVFQSLVKAFLTRARNGSISLSSDMGEQSAPTVLKGGTGNAPLNFDALRKRVV